MCLFRSHAVLRVIRADHAVGPVEDLVPVLERHAHEVSNQDQRQLGRAQRDEVALTLLYRVVDDLAADLVDALLELADHARGEAAVDEAAGAGVLRRVLVEHQQPQLVELLLRELADQR